MTMMIKITIIASITTIATITAITTITTMPVAAGWRWACKRRERNIDH